MDTKGTIGLIIGVFILIGLAYSPLKKNFDNNKKEASANSGRSSISTSKEENYSSNKDTAKEIEEAEKRIEKLEKEVEKKIEESKRSPYYDKIKTSRISGLGNKDPSREYITISTSLKAGEKVNITGWYFKSEVTGYFAIIGKAALLPFPFTRIESDVILEKGDKAYIVKGFSPIGISFRTNICTGYFEEHTDFTPSLQKSCPKASDEELPNFSSVYDRNDECIDLMERIPRCTTKGNEYFRDLPD